MASRTVRLDDEAERVLAELRNRTGMTISETLKHGLLVLRQKLRQEPTRTAWDVYERLDLGPGGYGRAASGTKPAIQRAIRRKHGR